MSKNHPYAPSTPHSNDTLSRGLQFPGRHWRNPEYSGLIPRSFYYIFQLIEQRQKTDSSSNIRITASYLEIYNEQVSEQVSLMLHWRHRKPTELLMIQLKEVKFLLFTTLFFTPYSPPLYCSTELSLTY